MVLEDAKVRHLTHQRQSMKAPADCVKDVLYVRGILAFLLPSLGLTGIDIFKENKEPTDLATERLSSSNSNYIDPRYYFLGKVAASDGICVKYI